MKRLILALSLILAAAMPTIAFDWTTQAKRLQESIVYLENESGSCTAGVIDSARKYVLTAAHCDGKEIYVDQSPAKVVAKDVKADLMVLEVKDLERPALRLALKNPEIGQEVASYGYGYGLERPVFKHHVVADNDAQIPELPYRYIFFDTSFLPGQSGGPVVDANNQIVAIVQRGNESIGIGVGAEVIKSKVGKYFGSR